MRDTVILGAGITGLTTAYHLKKKQADFVVLEQSDRVGGVIRSVSEKGFLYEEGPNSGVLGNIEVLRLFEELKNDCELEIANKNVNKRYVLKSGKWEALPSSLSTAVKTPLFNLSDKFRILLEPFRAAGKNPDETLAEMVKRRLGKSFLDYAIDPFILGVYAGDPNRLVPRFALPKLYQLEQQYGSFIKGSVKKKFQTKTEDEKKVTREVFSAKGGLSMLTSALYKRIGSDCVILNAGRLKVQPVNGYFEIHYNDPDGKQLVIETRKVISTIGAYQLDKVMPFIDPSVLSKIRALHYTKVLEVVVGFKQWDGIKLDAFGGLIPFVEHRDLLGVLFMSALFNGRAPEGGALFSVFMGGVRRPDIYQLPENEMMDILKKEFCSLMNVSEFQPDLLKIIRYPFAIPQYEADSGDRFKAVKEVERQFPGLIIGGNLRDGIGMADRILQAKQLSLSGEPEQSI